MLLEAGISEKFDNFKLERDNTFVDTKQEFKK